MIQSVCLMNGSYIVTYSSGKVIRYDKTPTSIELFLISAKEEKWTGRYGDKEWDFTIYRSPEQVAEVKRTV